MTERYHTTEIVPDQPLSDSKQREYLEWACREWCHDPHSVRYSCPAIDVWFSEEVSLPRAVDTIVTHGSGTIAGLQRDSIPFTMSIGMGSLEEVDSLTISTGESTFKSGSSTGDHADPVDEWIDLAKLLYDRFDAVLAFATIASVDEAGTGELGFRLTADDVHERRISDVFWFMILDSEFVEEIQLENINNEPSAETEVVADESLLVQFATNPLDFGPARKRQLRETVLNSP